MSPRKLTLFWTSGWLPDFQCSRLFLQMILPHAFLPCFMILFLLHGYGSIYLSSVKETHCFDNFELRKSVGTEHFRTALLSSVIVAIPMTVDILLDFFLSTDRQDERVHLYSRAIIITALAGPNLLLLSADFGDSTAEVYMYSFFLFRIATVTCGIMHLIEIASSLRNSRVVIYVLAISLLFAVHCMASEVDPMYNFSHHNFLKLLSIASYLLIGAVITSFGRELFASRNTSFLLKDLLSVELTVLTYAVFLAIMNICFVRISQHYGAQSTLNASSDCICVHTYIQMAFTVMVIIMQSRITRVEAIKQSRFVKERQAFIRYISHEIRTPLNTVFLGLEFVTSELMKWNSPKQQSQVLPIVETVNDIRSSCQISLSILDDLLTFDKMEGGKMTLELKYLNCCSFVASVAKPFQVNARERGITFNFCKDLVLVDNSCSGCLHIDSSKMGQVMRNLISNALKFTPVGGTVTISVSYVSAPCDPKDNGDNHQADTSEVSGSNANQMLRIEVIDSGVGISEIDQSRLFGQYVQFNANKLQKGSGSGLGLWISKGITELHGGCIGAISKGEGFGSTFFLELPVFLDAIDEGDGDADPESDHALSSVAKAFSNATDEYPTPESCTQPSHLIQSRDSQNSSAPFLTPTSHLTSFLNSNVTPVNSSACSSTMSATCSSVDTRESRDGYLAYQILNDTDGFLSSADLFMVTSTPQSRGSGRATRSSRAIDRVESYGGLSRTSGQCTPATLNGFGFLKASRAPIEHQDRSSVWAQRSGSITSDSGTDASMRGFKCTSPPTGPHMSDSSRHSRLQSRDSGKFFPGMIPDHLNSALEAVVAMSLPSEDSLTEITSTKSSPNTRARGAFNLGTAWTDEPDQGSQPSNIGKDDGYNPQLSGKSSLLSPGAEHKHSLTDRKGLPRLDDLRIDGCDGQPPRPLRFLIVDDSAMNRRMLRRLLSAYNYSILEATDGKDCVKVWTDNTSAGRAIDVVLVDNIMPIMSGPETAKVMRARGFAGLIIGVTGHYLKEDIDDFIKCGANAVLSKPLNFVEMKSLIQDLLLVGSTSATSPSHL